MNPNGRSSYRQSFADTATAVDYDSNRYNNKTYGDVLWVVEQEQLQSLVAEFRELHPTIEYLDFAAGSGRVISFMETLVDRATGIEISQAMAELARAKLKHGHIICCDITSEADVPIEGRYDLITAFRFVLNAEPTLRLAALQALARRLRNRSSRLIFNNHSYFWSHRILAYPLDAIRRLGKPHQPWGNYLTHGQVKSLTDQAGLRIHKILGCGLLSGKLTRWLNFESAVRFERRAAKSAVLSHIGVNQMYVVGLKE